MENKTKLLVQGIVMDVIGWSSYALFGAGEWFDALWAPIAAYVFYKMYPGTEGKIGSLVTFVEEALPMTDIVPTFTIMWVYKFILNKNKTQ